MIGSILVCYWDKSTAQQPAKSLRFWGAMFGCFSCREKSWVVLDFLMSFWSKIDLNTGNSFGVLLSVLQLTFEWHLHFWPKDKGTPLTNSITSGPTFRTVFRSSIGIGTHNVAKRLARWTKYLSLLALYRVLKQTGRQSAALHGNAHCLSVCYSRQAQGYWAFWRLAKEKSALLLTCICVFHCFSLFFNIVSKVKASKYLFGHALSSLKFRTLAIST